VRHVGTAILVGLTATVSALAQRPPQESVKTLKVADSLEVRLWAAEPMLVNPTNLDVDSRGRVWITEGLNYRFFANRQFQRVGGADRIKILEDTNGDGAADKVTVFAGDIYPVPMGIAVQEVWDEGRYQGARVFVGNSPDVLVFEDTNGDDAADKRTALLSGFGGVDHDHGVHGFVLGPDGKLYFTQGDGAYAAKPGETGIAGATFNVLDRSGRRLISRDLGTVLRVNLDGTQLERLAYRMRNDYEAAVDSFGNVFVSDNDDDGNQGSRMVWVMEGGNYGYRTPGSIRHWAEELPGIVPKLVGTGNGSPAGILVYEGDLLPEPARGAVLQVDAGTRQINVHRLVRHGAAFRTDHQVLLRGEDDWFRPIDAAVAPDGSLFVADWYDGGVGGHAFRDQTTGRIYRVTAKNAPVRNVKPDYAGIGGLLNALVSPNLATRFVARERLLARGAAARAPLQKLFETGPPRHRARALHVLADLPTTGRDDVLAALNDRDPQIRELAVRLSARQVIDEALVEPAQAAPPPAAAHLRPLFALVEDPDPGVRRELLLALRRIEGQEADRAIVRLALLWDGTDRYYLEAVRAALRPRKPTLVAQLFERLLAPAPRTAAADSAAIVLPPYYPTTTNDAFLRIGDGFAPATPVSKIIGFAWALERPEAISALAALLESHPSPDVFEGVDRCLARLSDVPAAELLAKHFLTMSNLDRRRDVLLRLGSRLAGPWAAARQSTTVRRVFESGLANAALRTETIQAIAQSRDRRFADRLLSIATDDKAGDSDRASAVEALGKLAHPRGRALAQKLVQGAKGERRAGPLAVAALAALADYQGDQSLALLDAVFADASYPLDFRRRAVQLLASSTNGADRLFAAHREKRLPGDLRIEASFLLHHHADRRIRGMAQAELPLPAVAGSGKIRDLDEIIGRAADPRRGFDVFHRDRSDACIRCHRVQGIGNWVGPDLSSIGVKYDRRELLNHILNPSGAIGYNYVPYVLVLTDGRVLTGLVTDENASYVILKTPTGQRLSIATGDIETRRAEFVSLMPDNLAQSLTEQDLADLVAYLATLRQPVSEVSQYYVLGPVRAGEFDGRQKPRPSNSAGNDADSRWRQLNTGRDGFLDLSGILDPTGEREAFVYIPIQAENRVKARVVVHTEVQVAAWHNGRAIDPMRSPASAGTTRQYSFELSPGENDLVLRLSRGQVGAGLVTTIVTDAPIRFLFGQVGRGPSAGPGGSSTSP
jgi:putative membrane-bound dehydrogenase-like protein